MNPTRKRRSWLAPSLLTAGSAVVADQLLNQGKAFNWFRDKLTPAVKPAAPTSPAVDQWKSGYRALGQDLTNVTHPYYAQQDKLKAHPPGDPTTIARLSYMTPGLNPVDPEKHPWGHLGAQFAEQMVLSPAGAANLFGPMAGRLVENKGHLVAGKMLRGLALADVPASYAETQRLAENPDVTEGLGSLINYPRRWVGMNPLSEADQIRYGEMIARPMAFAGSTLDLVGNLRALGMGAGKAVLGNSLAGRWLGSAGSSAASMNLAGNGAQFGRTLLESKQAIRESQDALGESVRQYSNLGLKLYRQALEQARLKQPISPDLYGRIDKFVGSMDPAYMNPPLEALVARLREISKP